MLCFVDLKNCVNRQLCCRGKSTEHTVDMCHRELTLVRLWQQMYIMYVDPSGGILLMTVTNVWIPALKVTRFGIYLNRSSVENVVAVLETCPIMKTVTKVML